MDAPTHLSLAELRAERERLQHDEDAVSYVRRVSQARLDLARAEQARRAGGRAAGDPPVQVTAVLATHLTAPGSARPPRPAEDFSDHPLSRQLDDLGATLGAADPADLTDDELAAFEAALAIFEQQRSAERRRLFDRIDALSAELVRRYRDGEASVDGLLEDG